MPRIYAFMTRIWILSIVAHIAEYSYYIAARVC